MTAASLAAAKHALREHVLQWRSGRDQAWLGAHSGLVVARLLAWPVYRSATTLMVYLAGPREVQTDALVRDALQAGRRVVAPQSLPDPRRLIPRAILGPGDLRHGPLGLPEPDPERTAAVPPEALDLVLVPGLAFDRAGHRLGRGRGFYDRFLASLPPRCVTCGVAFSRQVVARVPVEPHDRRVAYVVTEDGLLRCRS